MKNTSLILASVLALAGFDASAAAAEAQALPAGQPPDTQHLDLSPTALAISSAGDTLYVACATASRVLIVAPETGLIIHSVPVAASPLGLVLSPDDKTLYVTCAAPESRVCVIDTTTLEVRQSLAAGHTAMAPVLSPDGATLYLCHRFNNEVAFLDLASGSIRCRVAVPREPVAAALTIDGKFLLVANHLHAGRSDTDYVASSVTVIDTTSATVAQELSLPNGSGLLRDVRVSPDGRYACVTHLVSRFHLPTTQIERAWINSNALTLIDLAGMKVINTVLLDNVDQGAANPWAAAWSADSARICVTHAGTHELSVIDLPALLAKLDKLARLAAAGSGAEPDYISASRTPADVPNDLAFLLHVRKRIKLSEADRGPRAVVLHNRTAYLANYFSDTLTRIDLDAPTPRAQSLPLRCRTEMSLERRGEFLFNDATICFQGWQSCASCHSSDARVDGLNWDNLNDGIGNPKNVKSLLLAHQTPPAMSIGVRETAEQAVRAGIRHSLFTVRPEEEAAAIDAYLKSLSPIPSPYLVAGKLSPAAERGKLLFFDGRVGCAHCHTPPLYTNLRSYDVGTAGKHDRPTDRFDTPTLIELWRTAPYLHDGRAATVKETLIHRSGQDKRGHVSHLTAEQVDDLVAYLLSL